MNKGQQAIVDILAAVAHWARLRPDVQGVLLVGSHARDKARPDSDIDLVIIADEPAVYLQNTTWLATFGQVESQSLEDWGLVQSIRAFYSGGLEVEFGLTSASWLAEPIDPGTMNVLLDGVALVYDPHGWIRRRLSDHGLLPED
jgi:predicted nucleotidyltransferase